MLWYHFFSFVSSVSLFLLLNNIVVSAASLIVFFPRLFLVIVARFEGDRRRAGEGEGLLLWEAERHWTHLPGEWKQPSFEQNHGHPVCYRGKYRPKCLLTFSNYSTDQEFGGVDWSQAFIKYLEILQEIRRYVYWLLEHLFPTVFRLIPYPLTLPKASHIYVICRLVNIWIVKCSPACIQSYMLHTACSHAHVFR